MFIKEDAQEDCPHSMTLFLTGQLVHIYNIPLPMRNSHRYVIPNVVNEWNKLDPGIRSSTSYNLFRDTLLKFIRPAQRKTFNINDSVGMKLLIRLGFSYLRERKFRHGFRDALNPLCPRIEVETTTNYFLRWHFYDVNKSTFMNHFYDANRSTLMSNFSNADSSFLT